ncbi:hypothetical protein ACWKWN_20340 [Microbacterium trichothecenolyticum]
MTTQQIGARTMIERSIVETVLARVAVAAFQYYPAKSTEELGWTVDEDIEWALAPLRSLSAERYEEWRERAREVIIDSTADRRAFTADLMALADDRD